MYGGPVTTHHATYETQNDQQWNKNHGFPSIDSRRTRSGSFHVFDSMTSTTTRYHYHENKGGVYSQSVKGTYNHFTGRSAGDWSNQNSGHKIY